jgi:hypothetical protein
VARTVGLRLLVRQEVVPVGRGHKILGFPRCVHAGGERKSMKKSFRDFLVELDAVGELRRVKKPVDLRSVSAFIAQSSQV